MQHHFHEPRDCVFSRDIFDSRCLSRSSYSVCCHQVRDLWLPECAQLEVLTLQFDLFARTHRPGSRVEMSDLTWEEKEQVLRLLFAKMNGQRQR